MAETQTESVGQQDVGDAAAVLEEGQASAPVRKAVINVATNVVFNVIMAEPDWEYPDPAFYLADDDGTAQIGGKYIQGAYTTDPVAVDRPKLAAQLEAAVMAVLDKPIKLARSYVAREAEATAFKAGGYAGEPGPYLKGFADPAGMSYRDAADLVLQQAAGFRGAEAPLEALRMQKYAILGAPNDAAASAIFEAAMAQVGVIAARLA